MATVSFTQRLNTSAIKQQLQSPNGGVMREMLHRGLLVETQAKRNLGGTPGHPRRVDNGLLRSSVHTAVVSIGGQPWVVVSTNIHYARWIHDGTGIYGPRHRYITPRRAKRLRFRPKGSSRYIYARKVAGIKPNPFLRDALSAARG